MCSWLLFEKPESSTLIVIFSNICIFSMHVMFRYINAADFLYNWIYCQQFHNKQNKWLKSRYFDAVNIILGLHFDIAFNHAHEHACARYGMLQWTTWYAASYTQANVITVSFRTGPYSPGKFCITMTWQELSGVSNHRQIVYFVISSFTLWTTKHKKLPFIGPLLARGRGIHRSPGVLFP